jgi:dinuclear metal center YbgI/SA1388 family protein
MKLKELIRRIEHAVPPDWALPDDPIGLHVGDPEKEVQRVLVGLELSTAFLKQAERRKAELVLVHHPLIYRPLRQLLESDPVQRLVRELVRRDMALYAAHTNLDLHPEGMAKVWAKKLGCTSMQPLAEKPQGRQLKLATFTPPDHTDRIRRALGAAGAGAIGDYSLCSYTLQGEGTFQGSQGANPFIGKSGNFERVREDRLEMILPERAKWSVVKALYETHPYEEPAYELYPLDIFRDLRQALWIAEFERKLSWDQFMQRIYASLPGLQTPGGVRPDRKRRVKRIAISTGSGSSFLSTVASLGVDAYLTGEVGYHQLWEAEELGVNTVTVGHDWSESFFAETIVPLVSKHCDGVEWAPETRWGPR